MLRMNVQPKGNGSSKWFLLKIVELLLMHKNDLFYHEIAQDSRFLHKAISAALELVDDGDNETEVDTKSDKNVSEMVVLLCAEIQELKLSVDWQKLVKIAEKNALLLTAKILKQYQSQEQESMKLSVI